MSQPRPARPSRSGMLWRWSDVMRSILVLLVVIAAVALYQALLSDDPGEPNPPVDYRSAVDAARDDADYPVLAPVQLPEGWKATSVRYSPGETRGWHLGVLTADEEYVGLEQARIDPESLVESAAEGTEASGTIQIDGQVWQVRRDESRGETTLLRHQRGVTTLVTGSASQDVLEDFVRNLRA